MHEFQAHTALARLRYRLLYKDHENTAWRRVHAGWIQLSTQTPLLTQPPGPGKNQSPDGAWGTGSRPSASALLLHRKLFREGEWRLYVASSPPQANKYVEWPLGPGSCSPDTEVIQETIRCHLERAGKLPQRAKQLRSHSQGLTHPYLIHREEGMEARQLIHAAGTE